MRGVEKGSRTETLQEVLPSTDVSPRPSQDRERWDLPHQGAAAAPGSGTKLQTWDTVLPRGLTCPYVTDSQKGKRYRREDPPQGPSDTQNWLGQPHMALVWNQEQRQSRCPAPADGKQWDPSALELRKQETSLTVSVTVTA